VSASSNKPPRLQLARQTCFEPWEMDRRKWIHRGSSELLVILVPDLRLLVIGDAKPGQ
jgi:hypothetical protein